MALDFPSNPIDGQTYSSGNTTWTYSSSKTSWIANQLFAGIAISIFGSGFDCGNSTTTSTELLLDLGSA